MVKLELSHTAGKIVKCFSCYQKIAWQFLRKELGSSSEKLKLSHDPAILLQNKHLRELKTGIQTDTHTKISTAALFTKVKRCKQPKCPPRDE